MVWHSVDDIKNSLLNRWRDNIEFAIGNHNAVSS
jgi:hypothetical protein